MISTSNIEQAKTQIKNAKQKPIVVQAQDDNFNRKILEYGKFDILLFSAQLLLSKKDRLRQIDSGLNHVLAEIAAKNQIAIGFDISSLLNLEKKEKAIVLGKTMQNIRICRKKNASIKLLNYKNGKDAFNLLISLGASTQQAKNAL